QERLEVALEARAVVTLEHPELVDLPLEERALLLELGERAVVLVLRLADDPLRLRARVAEDAVALPLAVAHVLVVEALGEGEHAGRGLRGVVRRGCRRDGRRGLLARRGGGRDLGLRGRLRLGRGGGRLDAGAA